MSVSVKKEDARKYCRTCELPSIICACEEAAAYDKANPFTRAALTKGGQ